MPIRHMRVCSSIFFLVVMLIIAIPICPSAIEILTGDIEFPALKEIPMMRIRFEGQIVKTENYNNKIT